MRQFSSLLLQFTDSQDAELCTLSLLFNLFTLFTENLRRRHVSLWSSVAGARELSHCPGTSSRSINLSIIHVDASVRIYVTFQMNQLETGFVQPIQKFYVEDLQSLKVRHFVLHCVSSHFLISSPILFIHSTGL
jgi:hypothetical protein